MLRLALEERLVILLGDALLAAVHAARACVRLVDLRCVFQTKETVVPPAVIPGHGADDDACIAASAATYDAENPSQFPDDSVWHRDLTAATATEPESEDADDGFRIATAADRPRVCATIGAAFVAAASPEMAYFFGEDSVAGLIPVFAGNLFDKRVGRSTVWLTDNCDAVALWDAPAEQPFTPHVGGGTGGGEGGGEGGGAAPDSATGIGFCVAAAVAPTPASAPVALPADVQLRLDTYDRVVHDLLPPQPYWYLRILARHPDRQGSGVARRLSRIALDCASRDGVPAFLETTNPLNVAAYARVGWTVHAVSEQLQPAMTIWIMRHDGAAVARAGLGNSSAAERGVVHELTAVSACTESPSGGDVGSAEHASSEDCGGWAMSPPAFEQLVRAQCLLLESFIAH